MPDNRARDLDALWRKARQRLNLVDREPGMNMEQVDRLLAAGAGDDHRLRLPEVRVPAGTAD